VEWDAVSWEDFKRQLIEYRDREFIGRSPTSGENAYCCCSGSWTACRWAIASHTLTRSCSSSTDGPATSRWACHIPSNTSESRIALQLWIGREERALEALANASLRSSDLPERLDEIDRLYTSLIALRGNTNSPRIPTMGDAAASKILHVMVPPLFVMWDKKIRERSRWAYGEFMLRMHEFALYLREQLAPAEALEDLDGYLQRVPRYPVRKPLAKYVDEYNWWLAWQFGSRSRA
jgi:hypothetical protein